MKPLRESLLDGDLVGKTDEMIKDEIKVFLKENFKGASLCKISRTPNSDGKYEVSSTKDIEVINRNITSLTNGMFIWATVDGIFSCSFCFKLESLEGAPEKVGGGFYCSYCSKLKSLKGAPKEVKGDFYCVSNQSLKSLEGAPKEVEGNFNCLNCKILFTKDDVEKVSDVKGKIKC